MYLLIAMILMPMFQEDAKAKLWQDFVKTNRVVEESVPLFAAKDGFVTTMEYGKNKRKVLVRSPEMEISMRGIGKSLSDEHASGCLLYTSPSPRDATLSRMPSSA